MWYELHRTDKSVKGANGGGIAIGVINELESSLISEGNDDTEVINVEVWLEGFPTRLICGYGPQETDPKDRKDKYWEYLNVETQNATNEGAGVIIQMDGNIWAGKNIIPDDPNKQNQNGRMFENFLFKNPNLTVVNATSKCEGKITRERNTTRRAEKAILDFFIVCEKILPLVSNMVIDEKGENALVRYKGGQIVKADHNMLKLELNINIHEKKDHNRI